MRPDDFGGDRVEEDQQAYINSLTQPEVEELTEMVKQDRIYSRLISSIAPTVWGMSLFLLDDDVPLLPLAFVLAQ